MFGKSLKALNTRGKTEEQKKVIKYFSNTSIFRAMFGMVMSNENFDLLLNRKADEVVSKIDERVLVSHGIDVNEVNEIQPILIEGYYAGSHYFKLFKDNTFRASEYQMTYLMFSEKQMYAYSYVFDMTSADATEQTNEYFYEDITNIKVTLEKTDCLKPRPSNFIVGWTIAVVLGILLSFLVLPAIVAIIGVIVLCFFGFSRTVTESLILRITVPGDEFVCAMKPENIEAVQGMKAKIREKKR